MSSKEPPRVLNFDDPETKKRFIQWAGKLRGLQEVSIRPRKLTRSLNQNAYWHAAVVGPFKEWLQEQWGDRNITHEQAHELLKRKVLGTVDHVDKETGEVFEITPTSHDLDTVQFGDLIEGAAKFLAEFCHIEVLPPEMFFESKEKRTA